MDEGGVVSVTGPEFSGVVNGRRLSAILADMAEDEGRERISVGDLLENFGNRAFGAMIFIFASPNAIPVVMPGVSALLGAPLLFLTWQLMLGRHQPWFPAAIRNRSFAQNDFRRIVKIVNPALRRIEKMIRPRLVFLTTSNSERVIGLVSLLLAAMIFLPIPFGNMLPGLALSLFALGVLERDGLAVIGGILAALLSFVLVSGVVYGLAMAALFILKNAFASGT
jgi:hypothetical protein